MKKNIKLSGRPILLLFFSLPLSLPGSRESIIKCSFLMSFLHLYVIRAHSLRNSRPHLSFLHSLCHSRENGNPSFVFLFVFSSSLCHWNFRRKRGNPIVHLHLLFFSVIASPDLSGRGNPIFLYP